MIVPARILLLFLSLFYLCHYMIAVVVRDYNAVNFEELPDFNAFREKYLYGEEWQAQINVVLGVASPECYEQLEAPAFRAPQRHSGGDVVASVALPAAGFPFSLPADACAVVYFARKGERFAAAYESRYTSQLQHREFNLWLARNMAVKDLLVTNDFDFPVRLFWHEESQAPVFQRQLAAGESMRMGSVLGHIFSASSAAADHYGGEHPGDFNYESNAAAYKSTGDPNTLPHESALNIVDFFEIDGTDYSLNPSNRLHTCDLLHHQDPADLTAAIDGDINSNSIKNNSSSGGKRFQHALRKREEFASQEQLHCGNMFLRFVDFLHGSLYSKRLGLNYVQPQLVAITTPTGFEHRQLPADTYQWLKSWYNAEKLRSEMVEGDSGPCMNQFIAPSAVTHLPKSYKDRLSAELQTILEEWHGGPLQLTSIYGIRKYSNGSVLRMHVDTVNTHVVSAIINVDQQVEEDWPLLILDHEENEHWVVMQPGDMVLYESAKLLHGRPLPFRGEHYDNIFIHYKPPQGWDYSWI